jgi:predicted HAD superfamily phosphohydrolase
MLGEVPPRELMDLEGVAHAGTNAEALAAVVMAEALKGKQWAIECVRDQTEGKPVRAAQVNNSGEEVEEMLDRVSAMRLNTLAGKK